MTACGLDMIHSSFKHGLQSIRDRWSIPRNLRQSLESIDPESVDRIVFVCKGNVCRSPYAEASLRSMGFNTTSCGLDVQVVSPPPETAVVVARERGVDVAGHQSRSIHSLVLGPADCLVAMSVEHLSQLSEYGRTSGSQVTLLGIWCKKARLRIRDPFGCDEKSFVESFDLIDQGIRGLVGCLALRRQR
jgi:protein-tyrosine phosphatase